MFGFLKRLFGIKPAQPPAHIEQEFTPSEALKPLDRPADRVFPRKLTSGQFDSLVQMMRDIVTGKIPVDSARRYKAAELLKSLPSIKKFLYASYKMECELYNAPAYLERLDPTISFITGVACPFRILDLGLVCLQHPAFDSNHPNFWVNWSLDSLDYNSRFPHILFRFGHCKDSELPNLHNCSCNTLFISTPKPEPPFHESIADTIATNTQLLQTQAYAEVASLPHTPNPQEQKKAHERHVINDTVQEIVAQHKQGSVAPNSLEQVAPTLKESQDSTKGRQAQSAQSTRASEQAANKNVANEHVSNEDAANESSLDNPLPLSEDSAPLDSASDFKSTQDTETKENPQTKTSEFGPAFPDILSGYTADQSGHGQFGSYNFSMLSGKTVPIAKSPLSLDKLSLHAGISQQVEGQVTSFSQPKLDKVKEAQGIRSKQEADFALEVDEQAKVNKTTHNANAPLEIEEISELGRVEADNDATQFLPLIQIQELRSLVENIFNITDRYSTLQAAGNSGYLLTSKLNAYLDPITRQRKLQWVECGSPKLTKESLAFEACHVAGILTMGSDLGYLDASEVKMIFSDIQEQLLENFSSWEEYGDAILQQLNKCNKNPSSFQEIIRAIEQLKACHYSPWSEFVNPWPIFGL